MNCPYCNKELGETFKGQFCPGCGHKLVRCSKCGDLITLNIKFCPKDGTVLPEELLADLPKPDKNGEVDMVPPSAAAGAAVAGAAVAGAAAGRPQDYDATVRANPAQGSYNPASGPYNQQQGSYNSAQGSYPQQGRNNNNIPSFNQPGRPRNIPPATQQPYRQPPKKEKNNQPLIIVLVVLLMAVIGLGSYLGASLILSDSGKNKENTSSASSISNADSKEEASAEKEDAEAAEEKTDEEEKTDKEEEKKEAEKEEEKVNVEEITASVSKASSSKLSDRKKAKITSSSASSYITDNVDSNGVRINNDPSMMVDGDDITSWQEGKKGSGIGEWVRFDLKKEYKVKYITFKMGNWRDQSRYNSNERPKDVRLVLGGQEYNLNFPDGKNEYMVTFSDPLPASDLYLEILSVYTAEWDDCCISEMAIYY